MKEQNKLAEREFFDQHLGWGSSLDWRHKSEVNFFLEYSNLEGKELILDLGCGSGAFGKHFVKKGFRVFGLDLSLGLLKEAKEYYPVIYADAENIPFQDKSFDAVIGGGLIHHFPNPIKLLSEIHRILKNGGFLYSADPNILNPKILISEAQFSPFRRTVSKNENPVTPFYLKKLLKGKFQILKIGYFSFVPGQWLLSSKSQEIYLKIENLLQKTPLRYFSAGILIVSRKL